MTFHAPDTYLPKLRQLILLAAVALAVPAFAATPPQPASKTTAEATKTKKTKQVPPKKSAKSPTQNPTRKVPAKTKKPVPKKEKEARAPEKPGPLADFGGKQAPGDVVHVANWVSRTHNAKKKAFVLIDKKQARLYVFAPDGKLKSDTPILLGKAVGDDSAPGIGNKPFKQIKEEEKTTPAGRFLARPARNNRGEDIIWIDYNASVSMHRLRKVAASERRADRMATEDASDNRISYGCVNVPASFYDKVLKPTVTKQGAYVYVLPETRTPQQQFGSFDVT